MYRQAEHPIAHRQAAQARKPIVHWQPVQANDQLEFKQEIQWIGKPIHAAYLSQLVDRPVNPPPSEAVLPGQPILGSPEIAPPVAHQLEARQPMLRPPVVRPPVLRPPVARQLAFPQPGCHIPSLLSLRLQPNLNSLARTLSPQALRYVQLSIQIGQNLSN